jgi:multiple sugar transport system permease protein
MVLVTMMLPLTVSFIFMYLICQWLGYMNNYQALIVPFLASGFGVFYMRQIVTTVPDSLLEAARIDGMGNFDIFWSIVRPAAWPGIVALAIFSFINSWNAFFWPLIVIDSARYKTLPMAIADLSAGMYVQSWPVQTAAATILVAPPIVLFFFTQRAFVRGVTFTGLKEG